MKGIEYFGMMDKLVYYEVFDFIEMAINREKQIKGYSRAKKDLMTDMVNPGRNELYHDGVIEKIFYSKWVLFYQKIPPFGRNDIFAG